MPAHTIVEAAQIAYGTPPSRDAVCKMEDWLDANCRDWRFEQGALQGIGRFSPIVVSCVFEEPVERKKLQMRLSQQVRRWGFQRAHDGSELYTVISIDSYANGPLGRKMKLQVQIIMADIAVRNNADKQRKAAERRQRMEAFAGVLAKIQKRAVDRKLKQAMDKLRNNVNEAQGLIDAALEQEFKRRRLAEEEES